MGGDQCMNASFCDVVFNNSSRIWVESLEIVYICAQWWLIRCVSFLELHFVVGCRIMLTSCSRLSNRVIHRNRLIAIKFFNWEL